MWKENAKEIGRLSLEIEESSLGRDSARRALQGGGGFNRFAHSAGPDPIDEGGSREARG